MAFFTTILNVSFHLFIVGLTILGLQYFTVPIPTSFIVGMYFFIQTIRLHYGVNVFAVAAVQNPDEVIKAILQISKKAKGEKDGD